MAGKMDLIKWGVVVFILFITIINVYLLMWTPQEEHRVIYLHGRVIPHSTRPPALTIYDYSQGREPPASGDPIGSTGVFYAGSYGYYEYYITLTVPKKIVLSVGCDYVVANLTPKTTEVTQDIHLTDSCNRSDEHFYVKDNISEEKNAVSTLLRMFDNSISRPSDLSDEEYGKLSNELLSLKEDAQTRYDDASKMNESEQFKYYLDAHFILSLAEYKFSISNLGTCINKTERLKSSYGFPFSNFYLLPYDEYQNYEGIKGVYETYNNTGYITYFMPYNENQSEVIARTNIAREDIDRIRSAVYSCNSDFTKMNGTFVFQSQYEGQRLVSISFILIIGLLIGIALTIKFYQKIYTAIKSFYTRMDKPNYKRYKELSNDELKIILSSDSILAIILSIIIGIGNYFRAPIPFYLYIILLFFVIMFFAGFLCGISALGQRNDSTKKYYKFWCWRITQFGLFLFIFVVAVMTLIFILVAVFPSA